MFHKIVFASVFFLFGVTFRQAMLDITPVNVASVAIKQREPDLEFDVSGWRQATRLLRYNADRIISVKLIDENGYTLVPRDPTEEQESEFARLWSQMQAAYSDGDKTKFARLHTEISELNEKFPKARDANMWE